MNFRTKKPHKNEQKNPQENEDLNTLAKTELGIFLDVWTLTLASVLHNSRGFQELINLLHDKHEDALRVEVSVP